MASAPDSIVELLAVDDERRIVRRQVWREHETGKGDPIVMRIVADSSVLRDAALEEFLQASAENCAVISEVTAFESYKGDPVVNASRNYAICARFPRQILVLRGVREIIDAERHKNLETLDYVDRNQTAGFGRYCRLLAQAAAGDTRVQRDLAAHGAAAVEKIDATRAGAQRVVAGIRGIAQSFSPSERAALGSETPSREMVRRVWQGMLAQGTAALALDPDVTALPTLDDAVQKLAFRYGCAGYALALWWIRHGGLESVPEERLCNDILDMQQVALATRFDGLLTRDAKLRDIYEETQFYVSAFEAPRALRP